MFSNTKKKISAGVMSCALALSMAGIAIPSSAFADTLPKGAITIVEVQDGDTFNLLKIADAYSENGEIRYKFEDGYSWQKDMNKALPADNGILDFVQEVDAGELNKAMSGFAEQAAANGKVGVLATAQDGIAEVPNLDAGYYMVEGTSSYNGSRTYLPVIASVVPSMATGVPVYEGPTITYVKYALNTEAPSVGVEIKAATEKALPGDTIQYSASLIPQTSSACHGIDASITLSDSAVLAGVGMNENMVITNAAGAPVENATVTYIKEDGRASGASISLTGDFTSTDRFNISYTVDTANMVNPTDVECTISAKTLDSELASQTSLVYIATNPQMNASESSGLFTIIAIVLGVVVVAGAAGGAVIYMRKKNYR